MSLLEHEDTGEFRFSLLLLALIGAVLVPPYFDGHPLFTLVWKLLFTGVLVAAAYSVIGDRRVLLMAMVLLLPTLATVWLEHFQHDSHLVFYLDHLTTILFLSFISYRFLLFIVRARRVTTNIIVASMCLYLMLAFIWAAIYANINLFYGGAFRFPDADVYTSLAPEDQVMGVFTYYSFVTLSTLGYGDIIPVHKVAQAWAAVQAMIGQFYIAIIMARLVSLHVTSGHRSGEQSRQ